MSKINNLIKVLVLLNNNLDVVFKASELAEKTSTSERMVRKYITVLIENGIKVESRSGPKGGYVMRSENKLFTVKKDTFIDSKNNIEESIVKLRKNLKKIIIDINDLYENINHINNLENELILAKDLAIKEDKR